MYYSAGANYYFDSSTSYGTGLSIIQMVQSYSCIMIEIIWQTLSFIKMVFGMIPHGKLTSIPGLTNPTYGLDTNKTVVELLSLMVLLNLTLDKNPSSSHHLMVSTNKCC